MKLVRGVVLAFGFAVLCVFGATEWALRRRARDEPFMTTEDPDTGLLIDSALDPPSKAAARTRVALGAVGVGTAVYGVSVLLRNVAWTSYVGLALWLIAAIVLHDGVLVPLLTVLRAGTHRAGHRLPTAAVRLIEAGFVVGSVLTLLAVPEIYAKRLGTLNPTVLPGFYGQALLVTWIVIVIATALMASAVTLLARRPVTPSASSHPS